MAFDNTFDTSWLDAYAAPQPSYDYAPANYDYSSWYTPAPAPVYSYTPAYDPYAGDAYYEAPPAPAEPAWYETALKGLGSYAKENPKDVLGMGIGAGMGLYGLLSGPDDTKGPDLRQQQQANALLQQQLASSQGLNADAVAKLRAQIGGDYGDYADAAGARSGATAKLRELMEAGPDYAMLPEEQRQLAELDQKWQAKGMLGSSLHNAEKQQLQATFTNNALARYQSQIKALTDTAANFSNQTSTQFSNTGNVVNQGEGRQIQGLSSLASSGLAGAQAAAQNEQANAARQQARSNQLLGVGGEIFGRSYSNPASDIKKIKSLG